MISAIILTAGSSQRMQGINKLLLPYKGKTIISTVVQNILDAGIKDIIVVTGFEEDKIKIALQNLPVRFIHNTVHKKGMTTSIQAGVLAAKGYGFMICLGDMVAITSAEYTQIKNSFDDIFKTNNKCICIPVYNNQKGNPVLFSSFYRDAILLHQDMDGCRQIVQTNKEYIYLVEMSIDHVVRDIDYYDDYKKEKIRTADF